MLCGESSASIKSTSHLHQVSNVGRPRKPLRGALNLPPNPEDRRRRDRAMGNSGSTSPAPLGKTHDPHFQWKVHDFSTLLKTGATSARSDLFHCSGHKWLLQVTPMHKKPFARTRYVALCLALPRSLEPGHTMNALFELSIYNHSNGMYCGCKASYNFDVENTYSNNECLIPLQDLLKSSAFLVDDSCVFGVEILKLDICSHEEKAIVVQKKATTVQNFFIQKKGFVEGTYTWTMNSFLELDSKHFVRSPTFEVGGHKWYLRMYPCGDNYSTDCLSLYLNLDASNELSSESGKVVDMTLSILDQKDGKYFTRNQGLVVFAGSIGWGWPNFFALKTLKDPSTGYLIGSSCVVKADFTIIGSSNDC